MEPLHVLSLERWNETFLSIKLSPNRSKSARRGGWGWRRAVTSRRSQVIHLLNALQEREVNPLTKLWHHFETRLNKKNKALNFGATICLSPAALSLRVKRLNSIGIRRAPSSSRTKNQILLGNPKFTRFHKLLERETIDYADGSPWPGGRGTVGLGGDQSGTELHINSLCNLKPGRQMQI